MQYEVFIQSDPDAPMVHWIMGNYGVTPCGLASIAPDDPPRTKEPHAVTCEKCLDFVAENEPESTLIKCRYCKRFWLTEEYRELHELSHSD